MLEKINLKQKMSKADYKAQLPGLRNRLYELQKQVRRTGVPVVIIFEGWKAAGKDLAIRSLTRRLDPRSHKLHAITPERTYETKYPWLWRFWMKLPSYGEMAIYHKSWYRRVLVDRVEKQIAKADWRRAYRDIVDFERTIADDGGVVIKFWFHISRKQQRQRFKQCQKDPLRAWQITPDDWQQHEKYDHYLVATEEMLERTDTEWGPWVIVPATDDRFAQVRVFKTIIAALEQRLGQIVEAAPEAASSAPETVAEVVEDEHV